GHPIEGGITFAYDAPAPSPTSTSPTPSPTSAEPTPSPTSAEPVTPTPSPTISPAADTSSGGLGVWALIGIVLVLLAGVGVVAALLVRRRA
ncbi:MAG: copper resistance protein CopC, partial [Candidatus Nanopelagicales bacterium]